jgi:hypothetical protein
MAAVGCGSGGGGSSNEPPSFQDDPVAAPAPAPSDEEMTAAPAEPPAAAEPAGVEATGEGIGNVINGTDMGMQPAGADTPAGTGEVEMPDAPPVPEGDGLLVDMQCFTRCASDATDVDAEGVTDGFGFEQGASCIVAGSAPALAATPCVPDPVEPPDVPPGDGFLLGEQCFPPCIVNAGIDEQGFGFEQERSCILPGSPVSEQGVACIPPPPEVLGICPNPIICPVVDGRTLTCGCGIIRGFADRKEAIADAGGDRRFLASAMMETATLSTDYPFGDVFPGPDNRVGTGDDIPKTGGAANFGITKMNWTMMRQCHPAYAGLNDGDFLRGAEINTNLSLDIQVYNECRAFFGNRWFGGHRNGTPGLNNPNTPDIRAFQGAVEWILQMLPGHELDDIQFFVTIPAI